MKTHKTDAEYRDMILTGNCPALSEVCTPMLWSEGTDLLYLLKRVCQATSNGVGLAASQIGILKTAFVARVGRTDWLMCINSEILDWSGTKFTMEEGCLSYPGKKALVARDNSIRLKWTDENRKLHDQWLHGFTARVVQHEMDHAAGCCAVRGDTPVPFWDTAPAVTDSSCIDGNTEVLTPVGWVQASQLVAE